MQSTSSIPAHVAIIMDGNGRWATRRGLPRAAGHRMGARAVRRVVEAAGEEGIEVLTLYAFSADNWQRPPEEVEALLNLFAEYLQSETERCVSQGVRLSVLGRRDRLPFALRAAIRTTERTTASGTRLHLRLAIDYSARETILRAAQRMRGRRSPERLTRDEFARHLAAAQHDATRIPDVDLLIRTGGEQRLSDFLLWEAAYAELYFTDLAWPEFGPAELKAALVEYNARERRFGGLGPTLGRSQA